MSSPMAEKQLIVVVEGTMAMEHYLHTVVSDYIDKIIRSLIGNELSDQKLSTSTVAMSLVIFNTHGSYSGCWVQRSGWTRDIALFLQWLSAIPLAFGGSSDAAVAEGLSEALMMFSNIQNGSQNQQNVDFQKHCILVAASNPHPLPTQMQNMDQRENCDAQTESCLYDPEAVAKSFAQCFVSLSVICPKQLPILRAVYNAGKRNPRAADPPIDNVKNPHFLVLISENFIEARATLSQPGSTTLPSNPSLTVLPAPQSRPLRKSTDPPPISMPSVNGMNSNMMSGRGSEATSSGTGTIIPTPGISQQAQSGIQSQQTSVSQQFAQSKFVKAWEGKLCGQVQGRPVCFTTLNGYRRTSASETLAANWPQTLQLHRLIPQDHIYTKYVRLEDFLLFRAPGGGGFLRKLRERKLCAVIKLPSQNLLLSILDTNFHMLGALLPLDADPVEPYIAGQPQMQQQQTQLRTDTATAASASTKAATATIDAGTATYCSSHNHKKGLTCLEEALWV